MQRIKYSIFILLICCSMSIKAQSGPDSEFSDPGYMMKMTPPSPTAFSFSKYGDTQINESMGIITPQIPIGTYKAGSIALPISMDYSGNGVKVDQAATWTGINWSIAAGGAITRQVRGEDDFKRLGGSRFYTRNELEALNVWESPDNYEQIEAFVQNPVIDSEVDIFYFNFLNYSGSFYLIEEDDKYTAHIENVKSPLRIEVLDRHSSDIENLKRSIVIQTPDGVKYYFGGLDASEKSKSLYPSIKEDAEYVQTGFFLYKIQHLNGDEMYFDYGDHTFILTSGLTESYTKFYDLGCITGVPSDNHDQGTLETSYYSKYLERIDNNRNSFEVIFSSEAAGTELKRSYSRILNNVKIQDSLDSQTKTIDVQFDYYYPKGSNLNNKQEATRFFLKQLTFNGGNENHSYKMEYKNLENLPNRFSYDQDHLGYYNGKNNYRMLPKTNNTSFDFIGSLADKSPDFEYASIGALSKLYYPTGGHTTFEYEAPPGDQQIKEFKTHTTRMYHNDYTRTPIHNNPATSILVPLLAGGSLVDCPETPYVPEQEMTITIRDIFATQMLLHSTVFRLKIYNQATMDVVFEENFSFDSNSEAEQAHNPYYTQSGGVIYRYPNKEFTFLYEEGKHYGISLEVTPHLVDQNAVINAVIGRAYHLTYPYPCMVDGLGIRIKRTRDVPVQGEAVVKRFYYYNGSGIKQPQYIYESEIEEVCSYLMKTLTSSSINSLYANNKGQQSYGKVIVSIGGDTFENGAVEKHFSNRMDGSPQDYFSHNGIYNLPQVRENFSVGSGTLLKEITYKRNDNVIIPIKEIENDYSFDELHSITNNLRHRFYDATSSVLTSGRNLYLGLYRTFSYRTDLNFVQTRIFNYDNVSVSGNDSNNDGLLSLSELNSPPEILSQREDYNYDQYIGMPSKRVSQTSESAIKDEYTYEYPNWASNILTGISEPIKTQWYKDKGSVKELKMTNTKIYSSVETYPYKVLRDVLIRKGSVPGDLGKVAVQFHDYDIHGNPLEVSIGAGGIQTIYIWGYHKEYPIAKIVNSSYQSVADALGISVAALKNLDESGLGLIDGLRSHPDFSDAQITTYRYKPMVGLLYQTDPKGDKRYYEYDHFNRLKSIKDQEEQLIEDYKYHYKN